jgi:hypothetical protein
MATRGPRRRFAGVVRDQRVISRERSLDTDEHSRNLKYSLQDPIFRFWHKFVRPNLGALGRGFGADVWKRSIQPFFNDYMLGLAESSSLGDRVPSIEH